MSPPSPPGAAAVAASEHFELVFPPADRPWVQQALAALEQWRKELGVHTQDLPPRVEVRSWATTSEFTAATGQMGWMGGATDGQSIDLQPLALLAQKHILLPTLRHELTHLAVHRLRAQGLPRWFEEGLVLYLTGERIDAQAPLMSSAELDAAISRPRQAAETKAAYAQALERVRRLARDKGERELWRLLAHPTAKDLRSFR